MLGVESKDVRPGGWFETCIGCIRHFRDIAMAAECQHTDGGSVHGENRAGFRVYLPGVL